MSQEIKITILGDICPTKDYEELFDNNPNALFSDISAILQNSDYSICNFECPATECDKPIIKTGPNLKAKPNVVGLLKNVGFDAISLANNHILDYGEQGVKDTLKLANDCDLAYFGGGLNADEASKPLVVEIKGKKVAFVSFAEHEFNLATENSAGANWFDPYKSLNFIANLKKDCDYVIVLYHGGIEHYKFPSPLLQKKCRAMVDSGADAVFCQHSHCIGTKEEYESKPIVYGQGNSIFGYRKNSNAWNEGLIFTLILSDGNIKLEHNLLSALENGVKFAPKEEYTARINEFFEDSKPLMDPQIIKDEWDNFCKRSEALVLPNVYGKSRVFNKLNRMFGNKLVSLFVKKKKMRVTLAYIRCEAHHEVVKTILENNLNDKK